MSDGVIGVLAIQGDFAAHVDVLRRIGVTASEVRRAIDLDGVTGLIVPGGETTTMLKCFDQEGLSEPIIDFAHRGKPIFGTCAGAILLAQEVYNPTQPSLGILGIAVERNAYGRQVDSFIAEVETSIEGGPLEAVFIRAPRIIKIGPNCAVLASLNAKPVLVRERNVLAATFHPELTEDDRVHRLFLDMVRTADCSPMPARQT
ncbi:MAG TPA: pyridoxal 5'-phosphate synthase glutaminase subunit PdxT [Blastocatellia bacterium]|nr:pyridoxal 5'-phosphate synthase glutaminase subunit PdxT [Blastocatellia bacterium]